MTAHDRGASMSILSDEEYFKARAEAEWRLSETTADVSAAMVHANLAQRYERLAAREAASRPALQMAQH